MGEGKGAVPNPPCNLGRNLYREEKKNDGSKIRVCFRLTELTQTVSQSSPRYRTRETETVKERNRERDRGEERGGDGRGKIF